MAEPSPATRAIVAVFNDRYELCGPFDDNWQELCLAAALRAAAEQVVLKCPEPKWSSSAEQARWFACNDVRDELLAIAAELEGAKATGSTH